MLPDKPAWLRDALKATQHSRAHFESRAPQEGDVCIVAADEASSARLGLVLSIEREHEVLRIALLSPDVELGAAYDVTLRSDASGLPYDLLVQCDLVGPVWMWQVRGCHAISDRLLAPKLIESCVAGDPSAGLYPTGRPLVNSQEERALFKRAELHDLHELTQACLTRLVDGAVLDPEIFCRPMHQEPIEVRATLSERLLSGDLRLDLRSLAELDDCGSASFGSDLDLWLALQPIWNDLSWPSPATDISAKDMPGHGPIRNAREVAVSSAWADGRRLVYIASLDEEFIRRARSVRSANADVTFSIVPERL
jgi:hypothetical protein